MDVLLLLFAVHTSQGEQHSSNSSFLSAAAPDSKLLCTSMCQWVLVKTELLHSVWLHGASLGLHVAAGPSVVYGRALGFMGWGDASGSKKKEKLSAEYFSKIFCYMLDHLKRIVAALQLAECFVLGIDFMFTCIVLWYLNWVRLGRPSLTEEAEYGNCIS